MSLSFIFQPNPWILIFYFNWIIKYNKSEYNNKGKKERKSDDDDWKTHCWWDDDEGKSGFELNNNPKGKQHKVFLFLILFLLFLYGLTETSHGLLKSDALPFCQTTQKGVLEFKTSKSLEFLSFPYHVGRFYFLLKKIFRGIIFVFWIIITSFFFPLSHNRLHTYLNMLFFSHDKISSTYLTALVLVKTFNNPSRKKYNKIVSSNSQQ